MQNRTLLCTSSLFLAVAFILMFVENTSAQTRTWTDSTGTHKVEAEFEKMDGSTVVLLKANGRKARLPLAKLSVEDQAFLKKLLAKDRPEAKPKTEPANTSVTPVSESESPKTSVPPKLELPKTTPKKETPPVLKEPPANNDPPETKAKDPKKAPIVIPTKKLERPVVEIQQSDIDSMPEELRGVGQILFSGNDFPSVRTALESLKKNWPSATNETLLQLIRKTTTSKEKFSRLLSTELLIENDPVKSKTFILLQCKDAAQEIRWMALDYIEKTLPPAGIPLVIESFNGPEQSKISRVLKKYGEVAEVPMQEFLNSQSPVLRMETCSLMASIGTAKSIKLLEKIQNFDSNPSVALQAKSAIKKIKKRAAQKEKERLDSESN